MESWQEIIKEFKSEKEKYDGATATLILLYLSIAGEEYPSRMAKKFKEGLVQETGWNTEQMKYLRSLKDPNQLRILLRDMENQKLIVSRKEPRTPVTNYHYYRLDPWICVHGPGEPCVCHANQVKEEFYLAADFLLDLMKNDYMPHFKLWSSIEVFDFITFLMFLKDEAKKMNNKKMERILERQIGSVGSREAVEKWRIAKIEKEKRQIKWGDEPKQRP